MKNITLKPELQELLRETREAKGLTRDDLAKRAQRSDDLIKKMETEPGYTTTLQSLETIADALGLDLVEELLRLPSTRQLPEDAKPDAEDLEKQLPLPETTAAKKEKREEDASGNRLRVEQNIYGNQSQAIVLENGGDLTLNFQHNEKKE